MKDMQVKVVQAENPHPPPVFAFFVYTDYDQFKRHLESCIDTSDAGFVYNYINCFQFKILK